MKLRKIIRSSITGSGSFIEGIGVALAGNMGYGMSASLVSSNSTDDVIVCVKLAKGGGNYESVDVNLSEFNPRNATAVEMLAYCQYKDSPTEDPFKEDAEEDDDSMVSYSFGLGGYQEAVTGEASFNAGA